MPVLLRTCLSNIKSVLIPRPKSHIRFYAQGGRKREREVLVLNPKSIQHYNQPTFDLSGYSHVLFSVLSDNGRYQTVRLYYYHKEKINIPYPINTHGYLYYRTPSQDRPPVSGSFRFRVLPSTSDRPKVFAEGTDLLRPDGQPWGLSLYSAVHSPGFAPLVKKILKENLVEPDLVDAVAELPHTNLRNSSGVLYTLFDPFTLSLDQAKMITIITEDHLVNFRLRPVIDPLLGRSPYTGVVLAKLEKSDLPEHSHERVLVVRVLDVLSPINCVIPDYDFHVQMPEAGQLISKRKLSGQTATYRPWSIDISDDRTAANCLRPLFP